MLGHTEKFCLGNSTNCAQCILSGSHSIVNSRIMWVEESSLLIDILRIITSDDGALMFPDSIRSKNSL